MVSVASKFRFDLPEYYNPGDVFRPIFVPRIGLATEAGRKIYRDVVKLGARTLGENLWIVDGNIDFSHHEGALFVKNADAVTNKIVERIYRAPHTIWELLIIREAHPAMHINTPDYWRNSRGKLPELFQTITHEDVISGKWKPICYPNESMTTVKRLEWIRIYPQHGIDGTIGASLNPVLAEAVVFWSIATGKSPIFFQKGQLPFVDQFSAIRPMVLYPQYPNGDINQGVMNYLRRPVDQVECGFTGECCLGYFATDAATMLDREFVEQMKFMTPWTALITEDNRAKYEQMLSALESKGVQIVREEYS